MRAQACCALGFVCALFLLALLTGALVERFVGLHGAPEGQAWIGTMTLLLLWAAASLCLLGLRPLLSLCEASALAPGHSRGHAAQKRAMNSAGATVELQEALLCALRELREQLIQRLISAGADPRQGERLIRNAIAELTRTERPRVRLPDFEKRFLREVDRHCQIFAELRGLPYGRLAPVLCRHWSVLLEIAGKAGIEREETYRVVRDMIWKHGARWAASKNPETEILTGLRYALYVVGLAGDPSVRRGADSGENRVSWRGGVE